MPNLLRSQVTQAIFENIAGYSNLNASGIVLHACNADRSAFLFGTERDVSTSTVPRLSRKSNGA